MFYKVRKEGVVSGFRLDGLAGSNVIRKGKCFIGSWVDLGWCWWKWMLGMIGESSR